MHSIKISKNQNVIQKCKKNFGINYQINQQNQLEYGFNVLNNNIALMIPPNNPISKNVFIINTNVNIDNKIKNKFVLTNNDVVRIYNSGAGNCFFKVISQFLMNNNNNIIISYMDNYNNIIKTVSFIGQYEILNTCIKLKINICIYKLENESSNYDKFSLKYETNDTYNPYYPTILIVCINQNHYELLLQKIWIKKNILQNYIY